MAVMKSWTYPFFGKHFVLFRWVGVLDFSVDYGTGIIPNLVSRISDLEAQISDLASQISDLA